MIEQLSVKNIALIDEAELNFSKGLNILSGETGAGKSMVIDAVNFLLGQRAGRDFIRLGQSEAFVSGLFTIENPQVILFLNNFGIETGEDNALFITRSINEQNKNTIRINGKSVTVAMLKEVSALLVDVHGQHEHQSLLNPTKHIELLDKFCPDELNELKNKLSIYLKEYKELSKNAKQITGSHDKSADRQEYLKFQIEEISQAKLVEDEEEKLNQRHKILISSAELMENSASALAVLYGTDGEGAHETINTAMRMMGQVVETDPSAKGIYEVLQSISIDLEELNRELTRYNDSLEHDPQALAEVEARTELIYSLKRKYGGSVSEILAFLDKAKQEYDFLVNSKQLLSKINTKRRQLNKEITDVCKHMSAMRKSQAIHIAAEIEVILHELGMKDAKFEISVSVKAEVSPNGNDKVDFLISPNIGEPLKELSKIASGGEMSRVMLALKTVLSEADNIETFIFDEIDTGVSGRTAQKVAEKLSLIAKKQQIICITHLPQIASMADKHFLIEKSSDAEKTTTSVNDLEYEYILNEIARLLGGAQITEATMAAAKELKDMATEFKIKNN